MRKFFLHWASEPDFGKTYDLEDKAIAYAIDESARNRADSVVIVEIINGHGEVHSICYLGKRFSPHSALERAEALATESAHPVHYQQSLTSKTLAPYCGIENLSIWQYSTPEPSLVTCPDCLRILQGTKDYLSSELSEELKPPVKIHYTVGDNLPMCGAPNKAFASWNVELVTCQECLRLLQEKGG